MSKKNQGSKKEGAQAQYVIENDFSISAIDTIKKEIEKLLSSSDELLIKADNLKAFDLTAIQLLSVIKSITMAQNKKVQFDITLKEETKLLLGKAGFDITKI